ncbi:MAG: FAD-dependent oxidoreductase [Alphaproteobacteria bacterium]
MAERYDVVVVGAGAGGMTAALVAAAEGLKVLVLEKTDFVGGTTAISGGMVWAPMAAAGDDTAEAAAAYLDATVPTESGRDLRAAFLTKAPEAIAYLDSNSEVKLRPVPLYPDYYPEAPGSTMRGRVLEPERFDARALGDGFKLLRSPLPEFMLFGGMMVARPDLPHFRNVYRSATSFLRVARLTAAYLLQRLKHHRGTDLVLGNALAGRLLKSLRDRGVPIRIGAAIDGLETRDGRIIGVRVAGELIEADRAVILSTGGFSHDGERRAELLPEQATVTAVTEGATGDGLRLGETAGGTVHAGDIEAAFWTPVSWFTNAEGRQVKFPHTVTDRGKPGLIAVNRQGRRFTNEAVSYHEFVRAQLRADNVGHAVPAHLICDKNFLWKYGLGAVKPMTGNRKPYLDAGYLIEAPTLAGLATKLGLDPAALLETVERFNADARAGEDREFGRGSNAYQRHFGDPAVSPNPCLAPIETGPFYSVAVWPADLGTASGLNTDTRARVLDAGGAPIPGLYACGNDMASIMRGAYPGPGITLGPALTFGYLAAMDAAASP